MSHALRDPNADNPIPASWEHDVRGRDALPAAIPPLQIDERLHARVLPRYPKRALPNAKPESYYCESCGECMGDHTGPSEAPHAVVTRIVKPNHRMGDAKAGQAIYVELRHLNGPTEESTWSVPEWRAYEAARNAERPEPPKGRLAQAVEQMLPGMIAQTQAQIQAGKARVAADAMRAAEEASRMLGSRPAIDQEKPPATHDVLALLQKIASNQDALGERLAALEKKNG